MLMGPVAFPQISPLTPISHVIHSLLPLDLHHQVLLKRVFSAHGRLSS